LNLTPTIRPVLDMAGINSGLSSAFGRPQSLSLSGTRSKAANAFATTKTDIAAASQVMKQEINITITGNHIANDYDVDSIARRLTTQLAREQRRK